MTKLAYVLDPMKKEIKTGLYLKATTRAVGLVWVAEQVVK